MDQSPYTQVFLLQACELGQIAKVQGPSIVVAAFGSTFAKDSDCRGPQYEPKVRGWDLRVASDLKTAGPLR